MRRNTCLRVSCVAAAVFTGSLLADDASAELVTTTVQFQNGLNGYTGTVDRRLDLLVDTDEGTATNNGENGADVDTTTTPFFIDGDPVDPSRADLLVRFDNILGGSGIPAGATILNASLGLRTTSSAVNGNSQSGESYNVYRLSLPFDSSSEMDGDFGDGNMQFTPNADGVEPEQGEADWILGTFDHPVDQPRMDVDMSYSANVTRAVQSWVDGDPNYGVAIVSDHRDNDDGWSVHSTGSSVAEYRPQLSVTYTTNPYASVHEFQNGLNGYSGTTNVLLNVIQDSGGTSERDDDVVAGGIDVTAESEVFLDGDNGGDSYDTPLLIKFDDVASIAAAGKTVVKAELVMTTGFGSGASDSGGPYTVRQMLEPFSTTSVYSDFAGDVSAMEGAGQVGPEVDLYESIDEAELVSADVTAVVQNWLNGDPNYGFYVGANGTSNGWQIFAAGAVDSDLAPMLRVTTIPEPGTFSICMLMGLALGATRIRRR